MNFIIDILLSGIVAYISFTNFLADNILALIEPRSLPEVEQMIVKEPEVKKADLAELPSGFKFNNIPDILKRSLAFQQAAISGANIQSTYVSDPELALVNIYCTFTTSDHIRTTTGTGFFIDSNGVILTNAHVAQYLLLETTGLLGEAECNIRQGNPAHTTYKAELLYLSPAWIEKNASLIDANAPSGTGERDYALLYVTESISGEPLPARFPALDFDTDLLPVSITGDNVVAAGYPATDMLKNGASTPLIPRQASTTISELYTFGSNYADVFSVRGSVVGAEGSSGGPILNEKNKVIGMIATRGNDEVDGAGSLRAITVSHINRTIEEETGFPLGQNVVGDIAYRAQVFKETLAPFLISILSSELNS